MIALKFVLHMSFVGGATRVELARMAAITEGVLRMRNDTNALQVHTIMRVSEAILRRGVIHHHVSRLIVPLN